MMLSAEKPEDWFATTPDGRCFCSTCIPSDVDESEDDVQVWEFYSDGWLKAPKCDGCKLSLPVYCDGEPSSEQAAIASARANAAAAAARGDHEEAALWRCQIGE